MAMTNPDDIILYIWNKCIFCIEIQVLRSAWFLRSEERRLCDGDPCLSYCPRLCIAMCTLRVRRGYRGEFVPCHARDERQLWSVARQMRIIFWSKDSAFRNTAWGKACRRFFGIGGLTAAPEVVQVVGWPVGICESAFSRGSHTQDVCHDSTLELAGACALSKVTV